MNLRLSPSRERRFVKGGLDRVRSWKAILEGLLKYAKVDIEDKTRHAL
jgi:hypothetical protein